MEVIFVCVECLLLMCCLSFGVDKKQVYNTGPLFLSMVGGTAEQLTLQSAVLMLMKKQLKRKMDLLCTTMITCKGAP